MVNNTCSISVLWRIFRRFPLRAIYKGEAVDEIPRKVLNLHKNYLRKNQLGKCIVFKVADVSRLFFEFNIYEIQKRLSDDVNRPPIRQTRFVEIFPEQSYRVVKFVHVVALIFVSVLKVLLKNSKHCASKALSSDVELVKLS